jgi:hypothetical protein
MGTLTSYSFILGDSIGVWLKGLLLVRQGLYHFSYVQNPYLFKLCVLLLIVQNTGFHYDLFILAQNSLQSYSAFSSPFLILFLLPSGSPSPTIVLLLLSCLFFSNVGFLY